jgi:hypothetical protein
MLSGPQEQWQTEGAGGARNIIEGELLGSPVSTGLSRRICVLRSCALKEAGYLMKPLPG